MNVRTLIVERHDTENGGSINQVQIPEQAFSKFFEEPRKVDVRIFDPPVSEPPITKSVLLVHDKDSETFCINTLTELEDFRHYCLIIEESPENNFDYDLWWLNEPHASKLLLQDYDWQRAEGSRYQPERRWVILDGPGPRSVADAEGLEDENLPDWSEYPIDTVLIRTENRTIYEMIRRIKRGQFVMNPEFQREFLWSIERQSRLIESVLMRIPLPVYYFAEDENGRLIVVDGLQRLTTFKRFLADELRLRLGGSSELNGKLFSDLEPKLQNRVEDCNMILYIIDAKVPEQARLDIFERVNGGVPLTRQQMRNCLYQGNATRFLKDEASTEIFLQATGWSLRTSTMRDREFVNRFCAFRLLGPEEYKGEMDDFLARTLKMMNKLSQDELQHLSDEFRRTLTNNYFVFQKHAFRKHFKGKEHRSVLNASLWDVMSVGLTQYSTDLAKAKAKEIKSNFYSLMDDEKFVKSITYSPNGTVQVKHRFSVTSSMFKEALDANKA